MSRTNSFFRYVWRINAVLILLAAAASVWLIAVLVISEIGSSIRRRQVAAATPPIAGKPESKNLHLSGLSPVEGTSVFRAMLSSERPGKIEISSGGYAPETRNMLFVDASTGVAKWLLPSDKELITWNTDIPDVQRSGEQKPPVATVVLVKPHSNNPDPVGGRLLLLDVAANKVQEIATNVRDVNGASLTPSGEIAILFERDRKYALASFDRRTLSKLREREIIVPNLQ
ncbi:MAG: hypothetical protein ACXW29_10915 [Thermoanaerobaculia bacterium]